MGVMKWHRQAKVSHRSGHCQGLSGTRDQYPDSCSLKIDSDTKKAIALLSMGSQQWGQFKSRGISLTTWRKACQRVLSSMCCICSICQELSPILQHIILLVIFWGRYYNPICRWKIWGSDKLNGPSQIPSKVAEQIKRALSIIPHGDNFHGSENCPLDGATFFLPAKMIGVPANHLGENQVGKRLSHAPLLPRGDIRLPWSVPTPRLHLIARRCHQTHTGGKRTQMLHIEI